MSKIIHLLHSCTGCTAIQVEPMEFWNSTESLSSSQPPPDTPPEALDYLSTRPNELQGQPVFNDATLAHGSVAGFQCNNEIASGAEVFGPPRASAVPVLEQSAPVPSTSEWMGTWPLDFDSSLVDRALEDVDSWLASSKRPRDEDEAQQVPAAPPTKVHATPLVRAPRNRVATSSTLVRGVAQAAAKVSVTDEMVVWFSDSVEEKKASAYPARLTNGNTYRPLEPRLPLSGPPLVDRQRSCAVQYKREGHNDSFWVGTHDWINNLYTVVMRIALFLVVKPGTDVFVEVVSMLPEHYFDAGHSLEIFTDANCTVPLTGPLLFRNVREYTPVELHIEDLSANRAFTQGFLYDRDRKVAVFYAKPNYVQPKDLSVAQKRDYESYKQERSRRAALHLAPALPGAPVFGLRATAVNGNHRDCFWQPVGPLRARPAKNGTASNAHGRLLKPTSPPKPPPSA